MLLTMPIRCKQENMQSGCHLILLLTLDDEQ